MGGSFLFMKVSVAEFGPVTMVFLRVSLQDWLVAFGLYQRLLPQTQAVAQYDHSGAVKFGDPFV